MPDRQQETGRVEPLARVDHDMVDASGAGVDDEALHVADSLAIRTEDGQPLEVHHCVVDVSRIEITKP